MLSALLSCTQTPCVRPELACRCNGGLLPQLCFVFWTSFTLTSRLRHSVVNGCIHPAEYYHKGRVCCDGVCDCCRACADVSDFAAYVGGLDGDGAPHGLGAWHDTYKHGELLVGCVARITIDHYRSCFSVCCFLHLLGSACCDAHTYGTRVCP